jgi:site-specific recombinase XerD
VRVVKILHPPHGRVGYEILDDTEQPVPHIGSFLRQLGARNYSPNTLSAYAHDLLYLMRFLTAQSLTIEDFQPIHAPALLEYLRAQPNRRYTRRLSLVLCVPDTSLISRSADGTMSERSPSLVPGLTPRTINRILSAVSSLYEYLILTENYTSYENPIIRQEDTALVRVADRHRPFMGYASRQRPMRRTVRVKTTETLPRPLTNETITALLDSLPRLRDRAMYYLMLQGGLRPGEVLNLHLEDIEYSHQRVIIRCRTDHPKGVRTKSRRERMVDLLEPEALDTIRDYVLQERPQGTGSPHVFLVGRSGARRGEPLSYHALVKTFARRCARLGIRTPWTTPHAFRHTHATRMWEGGMRELTLAKRLGHVTVESTRIYTRVHQQAVLDDYKRARDQW